MRHLFNDHVDDVTAGMMEGGRDDLPVAGLDVRIRFEPR